jgi:hypothetical protein
MAKSAVLFLSVIHHADYLLKSITMSSLFLMTPHPGQDITPAAREFNGNFTVFFIGKANPSGPLARQTLHSGSGYLASWFGRP